MPTLPPRSLAVLAALGAAACGGARRRTADPGTVRAARAVGGWTRARVPDVGLHVHAGLVDPPASGRCPNLTGPAPSTAPEVRAFAAAARALLVDARAAAPPATAPGRRGYTLVVESPRQPAPDTAEVTVWNVPWEQRDTLYNVYRVVGRARVERVRGGYCALADRGHYP